MHPVQDERVMAGNGTIGLELAEELPDVDAVLVPWGGGGLFTGIASALAALRPEARVYAVQPETGAAVTAALEAGEPREAEFRPSFVDGAGAKVVLPAMWERARPLLAGAYTVTLDETAAAVRLLAERMRVIAEGAARSPSRRRSRAGTGRKLVCIVSGGNIDAARLATILAARRPTSPGLADSGSTNQTTAKGRRSACHHAVTAPLKRMSVTRKTTAVIPSARKTMPTIAKTLELEQRLLVAVAEADPVIGARRDQEDGAGKCAEQRHHVRVLLQVGHLRETLGERDGEQEREEHLHAGERHPQLIEQLDQLAVDPLLVALARLGMCAGD